VKYFIYRNVLFSSCLNRVYLFFDYLLQFATHKIVSFVGLSFSEEWKYYYSPDGAIDPLGSWRNVLSGKC